MLLNRIVGVTGDGQYVRSQVTEKLAARIGMYEPEHTEEGPKWLSRHWDKAHEIELAEKDSKTKVKENGQRNPNEWVEKTQKTISEVNQ